MYNYYKERGTLANVSPLSADTLPSIKNVPYSLMILKHREEQRAEVFRFFQEKKQLKYYDDILKRLNADINVLKLCLLLILEDFESIKEQYRDIIYLRYFQQKSIEYISSVTMYSTSTIKRVIKRYV